MAQSFRFRRGTAAQWASANPVLASGEPGYETDTGRYAIGDGVTAWLSLPAADFITSGELTFNVKDFGISVGTGGDDTVAMQAACNAAAATSTTGGEVYIPAGASLRIGNVTVPDKVNIRGAGQKASKITAIATGVCLSLGVDSVVSNLYLTGTTIAGGVGVRFRTMSRHTTLREVSITGHETGVVMDNSFILQLRDASIQSCTTGLKITGTTGCNAVRVSGGEIQGCTTGVLIDGANNYGLRFLGTTVEGNSGEGMQIDGATYSLTIRDSYFEGNVGGHLMFGGAGHFGTVVDSNILTGAAAAGIQFPGALAGRDVTLSRNTFIITTAAARTIYMGTNVIAARVEDNHTVAGSAGVAFDPSVDFLGTRLIHIKNGKVTLPPSAATVGQGGSSLNIPHGVAPSSPNDGDVWTTTAGQYARINGTTVGPLT